MDVQECQDWECKSNDETEDTKYNIWDVTMSRICWIVNVVKLYNSRPNEYNKLVLPYLVPKTKTTLT